MRLPLLCIRVSRIPVNCSTSAGSARPACPHHEHSYGCPCPLWLSRTAALLAHTIFHHRAAGCPSLLTPHIFQLSELCLWPFYCLNITNETSGARCNCPRSVLEFRHTDTVFPSHHRCHIFKLVLFEAVTNICLPYQCSVQPDLESLSYKICRSAIADWGPYLGIWVKQIRLERHSALQISLILSVVHLKGMRMWLARYNSP